MKYECSVCGYVYDGDAEGRPFSELAEDWECPVCGADRSHFAALGEAVGEASAEGEPAPESTGNALEAYLGEWRRTADEIEREFAAIQQMAVSGRPVIEPMRTRRPVVSWDEILVMGAQLAMLPLN